MKKVILIILAIIVVAITTLLLYIRYALPSIDGPSEIKVEITAENIARGEYLANHVAVCMDCHSERDYNRYAAPMLTVTFGAGGEVFNQKMGFPGSYTSKNITPYGLSGWSDAEIFHTITSGVSKDGKAMFPIMPYPNYGRVDPEDIIAIIAYLRTLSPVESNIPDSYSDFPMNFIINLIPEEPVFTKRPDPDETIAYGEYLATLASCADCHTPMEKGKYIEGMSFAGGQEFPLPSGIVRVSNITPDKETGIGHWSKEQFVRTFKAYADSSFVPHTVKVNEMNTLMPWLWYSGMTEDDLGAIYEYLMSLKAIENEVVKFSAYSDIESD